MKKSTSIFILAVMLTSLTACNSSISSKKNNLVEGTSNVTTSSTESINTTSSVQSIESTPEVALPVSKPIYDDVFEGVNGDSFTGAPMSYDEVMEMITSPLQRESGIFLDSFYLVETICAVPYEDARELNGWTDVCEGKTIYEVKVLTDLISGEEINRTEKIIVATGTVEWQKDGDPVYAPGERFTVALTKPQEGCDFLHTPASIMFRYDVVGDGEDATLYSRKSEMDKLNLPTSIEIDEKVITSTTQNPAVHTQKVNLNAMVDFLRSDWEQRAVSSHFEKEANE